MSNLQGFIELAVAIVALVVAACWAGSSRTYSALVFLFASAVGIAAAALALWSFAP